MPCHSIVRVQQKNLPQSRDIGGSRVHPRASITMDEKLA
jgi:hypothetical protein